ncbi:SbcC/MukB-like Walker B domain-containing protein [Paraflavitalea sp. CAU 1676]|uniref:ATP-binding protein n=1 Tax=Paraflavitalea sp. CAU 1676 TaxID=3032598 RepID=UPI0023DA4A65|nr:SbcC/MukB-like Walker B domain-containing protein [Paraflavitalea sp. CAU 1676]MDF2186783.1 SbcC/MukB-like Walker B domain-containing protein [Paraflavitalea sp. CAU 1676]
MLSLFSTDSGKAGFRLHKMQLYNWGTFDGAIYTISPESENSLLTGANGSGKTTFVHAMLTLLAAERRMRSFNQSAEGKTKNERSEESYVLGEYGEDTDSETGIQTAQRLRNDKTKTYSILVGTFKSEERFVTLAQCRWYSAGELKKSFIIAHAELSIEEDFKHFDAQGNWKKVLRQRYPKRGSKDLIEFFDGPKEYSQKVRHYFGMRSEKAQMLFNQTISLKILGSLDDFIRNQMLEEADMETEFLNLKDQFQMLSDTHTAIEKTVRQIELLLPVQTLHQKEQELKKQSEYYENLQQIQPYYFAVLESGLLSGLIEESNQQLVTIKKTKQELEYHIAGTDERERKVDSDIRNSDTGRQIADLEKELRLLEIKKTQQSERSDTSNEWLRAAGYGVNPSKLELERYREKAGQQQSTLDNDLAIARRKLYGAEDVVAVQQRELDQLDREISSLRQQKNNITGRVAQIRAEILEHCGATADEIPFIGELIQVLPEENKWEPALENLLHGFALRMIIPTRYYQQATSFINENDLKGRIVYHHYHKDEGLGRMMKADRESILHKLEIKEDSPYANWVYEQLLQSYDYAAVQNIKQLQQYDKAITMQGLTKNKHRHEKNDSPDAKRRQQYVLGWDNHAKIKSLVKDLAELEKTIEESKRQSKKLELQIREVEQKQGTLRQIMDVKEFESIDWKSTSATIEQVKKQLQELQKGNKAMDALRKQQLVLREELKQLKSENEGLAAKIAVLKSKVEERNLSLQRSEDIKRNYASSDVEDFLPLIEAYIKEEIDYTIDLDVLDKVRNQIRNSIRNKAKVYVEDVQVTTRKLEQAMRRFKNPDDAALHTQFPDWKNSTFTLSDSAEFVAEYVVLLNKLQQEELKEQQQRFKKYLNEEMINRMSSFKEGLDAEAAKIKDNIAKLNQALKAITYRQNPKTFIQLDVKEELSQQIKDFKYQLNNWKPNLAEYQRTQDDSILENSFVKIKNLLDELTKQENWRREVLDVRNWLKFTAKEIKADDMQSVHRSYTGTEKLSGGEQAQLTYTILGSAIAHQFGIHSEGYETRSFRFICVDEAFSRQDEEKARYLMDLCRQLHLQLMVVSPAKADEVKIVEPYISKVHFVYRRNHRDSLVYDMSIMQFQENRAKFLSKKKVEA